MATLAVRKTVFDGLVAKNQDILKRARAELTLGDPALYQDATGTNWYVWDDPRIDLDHVALIGAIAGNWTRLSNLQASWDPDTMAQAVRAKLTTVLVPPSQIAFTGTDNFQETLNAQGAPASVRAFAQIPADWTPVNTAPGHP